MDRTVAVMNGKLWLRLTLVVVLCLVGPGLTVGADAPPMPPGLDQGEALGETTVSPLEQFNRYMRDRIHPTEMVGVTGSVQRPSRYGPRRNDPAQDVPRHAYSPFREMKAREEIHCPSGGCDVVPGVVLIRLEPQVGVARHAPRGAQSSEPELNSVLLEEMLDIAPVFPQAVKPAPSARVVRPDGVEERLPDLTLWYRVTVDERARAAAGISATDSAATGTVTGTATTTAEVQAAEVASLVRRLAAIPGVAHAEPDYLRTTVGATHQETVGHVGLSTGGPLSGETDPLLDQQWHLQAAKVTEAWDHLEAQGLQAWGNPDVVVAVIDSGVDYSHPDLAGSMWVNQMELNGTPGRDDDGNGYVDDIHGATVISGALSGDPQDDHGHGTHVAGIIAAQAGNGIGGRGVAPNVKIMAVKAAQYTGVLAASDIARGIIYAVDNGADVINMSFGGYARSQLEYDALATAFGTAVLVAAAGNDGRPNLPCTLGANMYPAAYNWVLGVMAHDRGHERAAFSNHDCVPNDAQEYELMAPGVQIMSTLPHAGHGTWSGTSMAAPVVSGVAALARTKWNDRTVHSPRFIMGQIASTGPVYGHRALDALGALTEVPQPNLTYLEHWVFDTPDIDPVNDNDGIVDAGETVELAIVLRNHWGRADNVRVTLAAQAEDTGQPDPYVEMFIDTVNYGAVGSFNNDDNGLIRDAEGNITGVNHPFRFRTLPTTPNDHLIPFNLTITADNGYDPTQPAVTSQSRFYLLVQRGRELPRIISQDMTLTKDDHWLISDAVLIEQGATVTVTEGTQIQFFSVDPESPYSNLVRPGIQVEGTLQVQGTADQPVELFTGLLYPAHPIQIRQMPGGSVQLRHAKVMNPYIGDYGDVYSNNSGSVPLDSIENSFFSQAVDDRIAQYCHWCEPKQWWDSGEHPRVLANTIHTTIFQKIGGNHNFAINNGSLETILMDSVFSTKISPQIRNSVFLKNFKTQERWDAQMDYHVSRTDRLPTIHEPSYLRIAFPMERDGKTYVAVSGINNTDTSMNLQYLYAAQRFAETLGGHVVTVNDADEEHFLFNYRDDFSQTAFRSAYGTMNCGTEALGGPSDGDCWRLFTNGFAIGLIDPDQSGQYQWLSGEPVDYVNWNSGHADYRRLFTTIGWGDWYKHNYIYRSPIILELPGSVTEAQLEAARRQFIDDGLYGTMSNNAFLNDWWNPDINQWMRFTMTGKREHVGTLANNYWGPASMAMIELAIHDFYDDFNLGKVAYQPILTTAPETAYPFVVDVAVSNAQGVTDQVGAERVTFSVSFNRDMDTDVQPMVTFGPQVPHTDFPVIGDWTDARTWVGAFTVTPATGDGYQGVRVIGAVAADDPWLVTGDDYGRFRFEIITSGMEAMSLQASGGEGFVDLHWTQDDFDLLAGYNLYRSTEQEGDYERVNATVVPRGVATYRDTDVEPGRAHYYYFTVVQTDLSESGHSNTAMATPLDNVPPEITHTPITQASEGMTLTIRAGVTDNIAVQSVTLFSRAIGAADFASRAMTATTGATYSATLASSLVVPPGIEYYIQASDGVNVVRSGSPDTPHQVLVGESSSTVTFNAQGGSTPNPDSKTVRLGSPYGDLPTTTRAGHTFTGWFTAATGGTEVTAATTVTTATDHTLYAQWTADAPQTSTVTFDAQGGSEPTPGSKTVTLGSPYGSLPTTTREGHTFVGWFTAATGGTAVSAATTVTTAADHTLYAQWTSAASTLEVRSTGATSVAISAEPADYEGVTNYTLSQIAPGTEITLTAPAVHGDVSFVHWTGCDTTNNAERTCTVTMHAGRTVTARYQGESSTTLLPGVLMLLLDGE